MKISVIASHTCSERSEEAAKQSHFDSQTSCLFTNFEVFMTEFLMSEIQNQSILGLLCLFGLFFYIGAITIGGGLVAITVMHQLLVDRFAFVTNDLFYNMVAISESTPGPMGINMATYIGTELYGAGGGIVTTAGQVLPSIICIIIIAKFFGKFADRAGVKAAFSTLRPAVTGVVAVAAAQVFILALINKPSAVSDLVYFETWKNLFIIPNMIFYLAACVFLFKTKIHPLFFVAAGAVFGVIFC